MSLYWIKDDDIILASNIPNFQTDQFYNKTGAELGISEYSTYTLSYPMKLSFCGNQYGFNKSSFVKLVNLIHMINAKNIYGSIKIIDIIDVVPQIFNYNKSILMMLSVNVTLLPIAEALINKFGSNVLISDGNTKHNKKIVPGIEMYNAMKCKNIPFINLLLDKFPTEYPIHSLQRRELDNITLLMASIIFRLPQITIKILDIYNAQCLIEHITNDNETALDLARVYNYRDVYTLLLKNSHEPINIKSEHVTNANKYSDFIYVA